MSGLGEASLKAWPPISNLAPALRRLRGALDAVADPVVLADDHALMRRSLRLLLEGEEDVEVIAEAGDLATVVRERRSPSAACARARPPHARRLQHRDDRQAARASARHPGRGPHDGRQPRIRAARARLRCARFVVKELADTELPQAVRAAARGEEYVSPRVAARLDALRRSLTDDDADTARGRGSAADRARPHERRDRPASCTSPLARWSPIGPGFTASSGSPREPNSCATR